MIAGGTEAAITPLAFAGFCSMRALSHRNDEPEKASRPWDRERDGFVHVGGRRHRGARGDGGGAARAARAIYAEVVGYGMSADAYHISAPAARRRRRHPRHARRARRRRAEPDRASSTSTPTAPRRRSATSPRCARSRPVFGEHAYKLAVSSTKSATGHLLGAAGGLETGILALAIHEQEAAAHHQPRRSRRGVRPRLRPEQPRATSICGSGSPTRSGSAAPTAR